MPAPTPTKIAFSATRFGDIVVLGVTWCQQIPKSQPVFTFLASDAPTRKFRFHFVPIPPTGDDVLGATGRFSYEVPDSVDRDISEIVIQYLGRDFTVRIIAEGDSGSAVLRADAEIYQPARQPKLLSEVELDRAARSVRPATTIAWPDDRLWPQYVVYVDTFSGKFMLVEAGTTVPDTFVKVHGPDSFWNCVAYTWTHDPGQVLRPKTPVESDGPSFG